MTECCDICHKDFGGTDDDEYTLRSTQEHVYVCKNCQVDL